MNNIIDGIILKNLLNFGYNNLKKNVKVVNELNVFPIPDGDTGDNMCMTFSGGLEAVKDKSIESLSEMSKLIADGMLLNARGNSGVILSQLFYGFSIGLKDYDKTEVYNFARQFSKGVEVAYQAVDEPAEGTILTVARKLSNYLQETNIENLEAKVFLKNLISETKKYVLETPNELDVLKKAEVVDSGGAGLYYIVEGFYNYLKGIELNHFDENITSNSKNNLDVKFDENSELKFGYCSEVLLQLQRCKCDIDNFDIDKLREFLNLIGDSLIVVKTGSIIKVHVHTFTPYKLLEYCQQFGEFLKIKIENMTIQHSEAIIRDNFRVSNEKINNTPKKKFGIVAVASGDGIVKMFESLGVDYVINGGQTDNPSAQSFIDAFEKVNAENIFVLPNNGNIILTAKQAANMYKLANINVIETKNIGDCYAILSMLNYESNDVEAICQKMNESMIGTKTGIVSKAIRHTEIDEVKVNVNDFIGFCDKKLLSSNPVKVRATCDLINKLDKNNEICILIYGKDFSEQEKEIVKTFINEKHKNLELFEIVGNQDIYDCYVIIQ